MSESEVESASQLEATSSIEQQTKEINVAWHGAQDLMQGEAISLYFSGETRTAFNEAETDQTYDPKTGEFGDGKNLRKHIRGVFEGLERTRQNKLYQDKAGQLIGRLSKYVRITTPDGNKYKYAEWMGLKDQPDDAIFELVATGEESANGQDQPIQEEAPEAPETTTEISRGSIIESIQALHAEIYKEGEESTLDTEQVKLLTQLHPELKKEGTFSGEDCLRIASRDIELIDTILNENTEVGDGERKRIESHIQKIRDIVKEEGTITIDEDEIDKHLGKDGILSSPEKQKLYYKMTTTMMDETKRAEFEENIARQDESDPKGEDYDIDGKKAKRSKVKKALLIGGIGAGIFLFFMLSTAMQGEGQR